MVEVENLINERKDDINNTMILLREHLESIQYATLIKSNIFIMLYNLIEGVVTQTYTFLFDTIRNNVNTFDELNNKIKLIYLNLQVGMLEKPADILNYLSRYQDIHKISYEEYTQKRTLYSGNLDAKTIRELNDKIGIRYELHVDNEEKMLTVKNNRNKLAHGELSYQEVGRNYTDSDLSGYIDAVFNYVTSFKRIIEQYINGEGYLENKVGSIVYSI